MTKRLHLGWKAGAAALALAIAFAGAQASFPSRTLHRAANSITKPGAPATLAQAEGKRVLQITSTFATGEEFVRTPALHAGTYRPAAANLHIVRGCRTGIQSRAPPSIV